MENVEAKKKSLRNKVFSVIGVIFLIGFVSYLLHSYFMLMDERDVFRIYRALPVGMSQEDVEKVAGKPQKIITNEDYRRIIEDMKKKNFSFGQLQLPVKNKVYIYKRHGYDLLVFFNEEDKVEMVFWGDSGLRPVWGNY